MLGVGFGELLVIAIIFIIVVNPKDYPKILNKIGILMHDLKNKWHNFLIIIKTKND